MSIRNPKKRKEVPFLSDIKLFVDRNATTSSKQYDVLIKAIQKHGGIIAETMEHVDFAILPATTQAQETSNVKIADLSWLQRCLSRNELVDIAATNRVIKERYRPSCKTLDQVSSRFTVLPYACQRVTTESGNKNACLTDPLLEMEKYYLNIGDINRQRAYRRAIAVIKCLDRKIEKAQDIEGIQYIGSKMANKVEEILTTGTLGLLSHTRTEYAESMKELTNIHGVGSIIANNWYKQGLRTVHDVLQAHENRKLKPELTRVQILGLKYHTDTQVDVTRKDLSIIVASIRSTLDVIDTAITFEVAGGMRRGKESGHDVDILVKNITANREVDILRQIEAGLQPLPLKVILQSSVSDRENHVESDSFTTERHPQCLGFFEIGQGRPLRRVDIVVVPEREWGFALLGWTGSKHFEQSIRQYSKDQKGWSLNNHGFFDATGCRLSIDCSTEMVVFEALGLPYRLPSERCC